MTILNGVLSSSGGTGTTASGTTQELVAVPPSATPSFDGNAGTVFSLALAANVTGSSFQNLKPGVLYTLLVSQPQASSGGPYSFVFPAGFKNPSQVAARSGITTAQLVVALSSTTAVATVPATYY